MSCGRIVAIVMTIQNEFLDQAGSPAEGHYGDTFTRRYGSMTPSVVMDGSPADVVTPRRRHAKIKPRAPYVVVVDSHDDSREMYSEWLTWRGIRVTAVPTARDALAVINGALPDAVIACLRLSDGDAFALFSAIRASSHSVPIVALSTSMPDHERAACDQQIDAVLLKPCLPSVLHEVVKKTLTRSQVGQKARPQ